MRTVTVDEKEYKWLMKRRQGHRERQLRKSQMPRLTTISTEPVATEEELKRTPGENGYSVAGI